MEQHSTKRKKRRTRTDDTKNAGFEAVAKGALRGGAAAVGCMLVLALLSTALCMTAPDPLSLSFPIGLAILYVSSALGGCISSVKLRSNISAALTSAAFCGFTVVILTGICSVLQSTLSPEQSHGVGTVPSLLLRFATMAVSIISSYVFCKLKPKYRRKKR